jgi:hypothetical protein
MNFQRMSAGVRLIISAFLTGAAITGLLWPSVLAEAPTGTAAIKPESIVRFTQGGVVCLTQDALLEITLHSINGEKTKVAAMQMSPENPDGPCSMLDPKKRYKVLSAQYNNPDAPQLGLLEIVGEKVKAANGGWAFTIGVEVLKKP